MSTQKNKKTYPGFLPGNPPGIRPGANNCSGYCSGQENYRGLKYCCRFFAGITVTTGG